MGFGGDRCHSERDGAENLMEHVHDWEGRWRDRRRAARLRAQAPSTQTCRVYISPAEAAA